MMATKLYRPLLTVAALAGSAVGVTDVRVYREKRVRKILLGLTVWAGLGLFTVIRFGEMPWSLILGVTVDGFLLFAGFQAIRSWDDRLLQLEEDAVPQCTQRKGRWRCAGMNGHLGPHLFGPLP